MEMKRYKRWIVLLQRRYSICFIILTISGYLYIISTQTLIMDSEKEINLNYKTNRSKRRKLSVYFERTNYNTIQKSYPNEFSRKDKHILASLENETRSMYEFSGNRQLNKTYVLHGSSKRTFAHDHKSKRLPQVLIIGVKKCGTRALLEYLRLHPDIKAPGPEPHFFDKNFHLGLNWYRERMPMTTKEQITMEKTPRYFVNADAPQRVWNMSRSIKLILVVRDPVTRAISDFTQGATKRNYLHQSVFIRKAFRCNGTGDVNTHWSIINTGLYIQHIQRWLRYFPLKHIYFVSGENLISDPAKELKDVQNFLGVNNVITDKHFYFNATKGFPCLVKHSRRSSSRCFNSSKGRHHLNIDAIALEKLRKFYYPYNKEFYKLTGRDFGW